jgi:hypothetical protein
MKEVKRLEDEIESEERARTSRETLDAAKRYNVPPSRGRPRTNTEENPARVEFIENEHQKYQKGDALGAIVSARMRFGPWEQQRAVEWSRKAYGERSPQTRALQQSSFTAGGAFIPENFVGREFIERLTATAQVRKAGARSLPLDQRQRDDAEADRRRDRRLDRPGRRQRRAVRSRRPAK